MDKWPWATHVLLQELEEYSYQQEYTPLEGGVFFSSSEEDEDSSEEF
jgi:hypothetical protein